MPNPAITTAYAGEDIGQILQLMVLGNEAVDKGSFNIFEDVQKTKEITRGFVSTNPIQEYQSQPTVPSNSLSFTPRTLTPARMMVFDLVNPMDFQNYWREYQPKGPLADKILAPEIQKAIVALYSKQIDNQLGRLIWQGDTTLAANSPLRFFNGIVTRAAADGAVVKSTPVGNLTSANIIAQLTALDALIPDALYNDPNYVFHMSTADVRKYMDALIALTNKDKGPSDFGRNLDDLTFKNRKIVNYSGFPTNFILAAKADTNPLNTHLHIAVNMTSDPDNLKIERFRPEGDQFFLKASFEMDVNYSFSEELVMYKPS